MKKRSLTIAGHRTSVSLEDAFWEGLKEIAAAQKRSLSSLVAEIDAGRGKKPLSSTLRLHVLAACREKILKIEGRKVQETCD